MQIAAIDPGTEESAVVFYETTSDAVTAFAIYPNSVLLELLRVNLWEPPAVHLIIEQIESMGMPVGRETFETVFWTGKFAEAWFKHGGFDRVTRRQVKIHLCNTVRATDGNIRQALIDRYGGSKLNAIGTKKFPGPLFGLKSHCWAALAVAVTWADKGKGAV